MKKKWIIVLTALALILALGLLCYFGIIWPNSIFAAKYAVHGIDVSNHQKDIDWTKVTSDRSVKFAFIKATEGVDYVDPYFTANWEGAAKAGLYRGAYHYFTATDSGFDQAMNFIGLVPVETGCLPPVVDIEEMSADPTAFRKDLGDFLNLIEAAYGQKPIIYAVHASYEKYIKGNFEGYPVWIRSVITPAGLSDKRPWLFWQYNNRGRVGGIHAYVDQNVFNGSMDELKALLSDQGEI